jgi:hypothetical protein
VAFKPLFPGGGIVVSSTAVIASSARPGSLLSILSALPIDIVTITLWATGFLCILNVALAIVYRRRLKREVISYYAVCIIELAIFVFVLLFQLKVITQVPYHLPPGLPIDRTQIGAALAIGIGLFPAAYWHRTNISDLPRRIAQDAKTMNKQKQVYVRKSEPGEWMN